MKLRTRAVLLAVTATASLVIAVPAQAIEEVPVPGTCLIARAGLADLVVADTDSCVGHEITNCQVTVTAMIAGKRNARGKDAIARGGCGSSFVEAHAEVPRRGGKDEDSSTSAVGSPMQACTFEHPGGGAKTLWYVACQYTYVEP
jgi:hypothetical protein